MKTDFTVLFENKGWVHVYRDKVTFHGHKPDEDKSLTWLQIWKAVFENDTRKS